MGSGHPEEGGQRERDGGADTRTSPETVALVRRFQAGDRQALERLMARFYPRVQRIVRVRTGAGLRSRMEIDDVVQDVLLRALRSLDRFEVRPDGRLIHWLATLAQRDSGPKVNIDAMRAATKDSSLGWDLVAESTLVPDKASRNELERIVDECLQELGEQQREVILLRDYAGTDWELIARELGRPSVGAAQQLHRRARVELAARVQRRI